MATTSLDRTTAAASRARALVEPVGPSSEPFRTLRVALELSPDPGRSNLMLFTSAGPAEGKSTIAANYAFISAVSGRRVLVIDADLRKPAQHEIFGIPRSPGLTEVVLARLDLHSAAQPISVVSGLHVLTAGSAASTRAGLDVTASAVFRDLLAQASGDYDLVVIDTPPLLQASDASHIAAQAEVNVVMVVARNQGTRKLKRALSKLELVGANVLGFVVNYEGQLSQYGYE